MSWQALGWATKCRVGDDGEKLLLIMLANYANEDGESWYSQERLSFDTEVSVRTLRRRINGLVEKGFIEIVPRRSADGTKATSLVRLVASPAAKTVHESEKSPDTSGQNELTSGQNGGGTSGQQVAAQESSVNHQKESSVKSPRKPKKALAYTEEFERDVWQLYPMRNGTSKSSAFKKWCALSPEEQKLVKYTIPIYARMKDRESFTHHLEFYISRRIFETVTTVTPGTAAAAPAQIDRETWENLAKLYQSTNNWSRQWGPEPGSPGCRMPLDLQKIVNSGLTAH
jgi:hypothetical protein